MTTTIDTTADRALKAKHRAIWALGDYPSVAIDVIPELGPELVAASRVRPGDRVLDVGSSRVDLQACKLEYSIVSPK